MPRSPHAPAPTSHVEARLVKIDSTGAVYGCYKDLENVEREIVLGKTYVRALKRVNHVKSFVDS